MKNKNHSNIGTLLTAVALTFVVAAGSFTIASADNTPVVTDETSLPATVVSEPDTNPAVYVAQMNANSVVGIITNTQSYNRNSGEVVTDAYAQGSGVVIAEGGYILTNYHVIEGSSSTNLAYQVLMPNGDKVDATVRGTDSSLDLAVLKVSDEDAQQLKPVTVGSSSDLVVGGTVIAIGNPGGEVLANTVTQGIVSALERSSVDSSNASRKIDYIQHDAAINSGNSGGGLFNYKGELIGINTLKYSGKTYSSVSFEGLGFAIPIDTAYPIAMQLIENGKVLRPQMGISVKDYQGPDEPMNNYAPASVCVYAVNPDSPAEAAGIKQYDFIYALNGERVTTYRDLTSMLDQYSAGDTVSITIVRYNNVGTVSADANSGYSNGYFISPFGNFGRSYGSYNGNYGNNYDGSYNANTTDNTSGDINVSGGFEYITLNVKLELPSDDAQ